MEDSDFVLLSTNGDEITTTEEATVWLPLVVTCRMLQRQDIRYTPVAHVGILEPVPSCRVAQRFQAHGVLLQFGLTSVFVHSQRKFRYYPSILQSLCQGFWEKRNSDT